ncbi:MAG: hypothetical protein WBI40_04235 [Methylococcaceae bacterium]
MIQRKQTIQRVELNKFYYIPIFCPFCGQCVQTEQNDSLKINPCVHTLFIGHDMGFEFRSERFNLNLEITHIENDDYWEEGIDFLTDKVTIVDSVKFATYVGMPSGFGTYIGFAPIDEE